MTLSRIFKAKIYELEQGYNTFAYYHGTRNPNKKIHRRIAKKRFKQDKFYNGFYEFVEENRKKLNDEK